jgi:hypothetical protein
MHIYDLLNTSLLEEDEDMHNNASIRRKQPGIF